MEPVLLYVVYRKRPRSEEQDLHQEEEEGHAAEEATVQRSSEAAGETDENTPASSQETTAEAEQLSRRERSSSPPPPASRSVSPSRYMRRLPPPPGFYLPKEHSYAQLCPLLWRRRYDQAIDCLEKALRQLHAARRRENRLRSTMLRLRDKRLKHTLLPHRDDASKDRGEEDAQGRGGHNQDGETDAKHEDTELLEDRFRDQMEFVGRFLPDANSWCEEEKGYCSYCGRGQAQGDGQLSHSVSKTRKDAQHTAEEEAVMIQTGVETASCDNAENTKEIQIVTLEASPVKTVQTTDSHVTNSHLLLQTQVVQHINPAALTVCNTSEQSVQFLGSQQELLLSDRCETESESTGQDQLFWIQDDADGQVILVPVPTEDGLQSFLKMGGVTEEAQTILVSEVDLKRDYGLLTDVNSGEAECEDEHGDQNSVINSTSVEIRDVREKLKEHLEGFHLQLSTEFIN